VDTLPVVEDLGQELMVVEVELDPVDLVAVVLVLLAEEVVMELQTAVAVEAVQLELHHQLLVVQVDQVLS